MLKTKKTQQSLMNLKRAYERNAQILGVQRETRDLGCDAPTPWNDSIASSYRPPSKPYGGTRRRYNHAPKPPVGLSYARMLEIVVRHKVYNSELHHS